MKRTQLKQGYTDDSIPTYLTVVTDDDGKIIEIFNNKIPLLRTAWFDGASLINQPDIIDVDDVPHVTFIEGL